MFYCVASFCPNNNERSRSGLFCEFCKQPTSPDQFAHNVPNATPRPAPPFSYDRTPSCIQCSQKFLPAFDGSLFCDRCDFTNYARPTVSAARNSTALTIAVPPPQSCMRDPLPYACPPSTSSRSTTAVMHSTKPVRGTGRKTSAQNKIEQARRNDTRANLYKCHLCEQSFSRVADIQSHIDDEVCRKKLPNNGDFSSAQLTLVSEYCPGCRSNLYHHRSTKYTFCCNPNCSFTDLAKS